MIYCVWYPSGGFGHYINAILSLYGHNFVRPKGKPLFSDTGNSHALDLVAPMYFHDQSTYSFDFDPKLNYSVIVDNGINNESTRFQQFFPDAKIFKMCYSDLTWPVVANTMFVKALNSSLESELVPNTDSWDSNDAWVQREKYFLFLRDHSLRHAWKPDNSSTAIFLEDLLDYNTLRNKLNLDLENFEFYWKEWWQANQKYYLPVINAQKILQGQFMPVTDIWTQAVVYYQIWCRYGFEVPHNTYSNWFEDQDHYVKLLKDHGVDIDSY